MKLLAIGDFHGKFPEKLMKRIKREKPDLIVSVGDYFPWSMKKEFFKYCYATNYNLWDVLGKKKFKENTLKDLKKGEKAVIKKLNNFGRVITVTGNYDQTAINDQYPSEGWRGGWKWANQDFFSEVIKKYKNIKRFEYNYVKFGKLIFIGGYGHSSPGRVKSKAYQKHRKKLEQLFKKFKKENKERKVIFVFHNMPYKCLDKIRDKKAPEIARGRHTGSKLTRRIINKYQPVLGIGGHIHENQGKQKIGRTTVVNTGAALEGKAALIDFDGEKGKVKNIKFIR